MKPRPYPVVFFRWLPLLLAALCVGAANPAAAAPAPEETAQTVIHMLDYVAVDYPEYVRDGQVLNASEYEEQREFAKHALLLLSQLPEVAGKTELLAKARQLHARVNAKAPGADVSALVRSVAADVIRSYRLAVAPRQAPVTRA